MSKKDFVTAWLLAARTTGNHTPAYMLSMIVEAEDVWEALEQRYEGESND